MSNAYVEKLLARRAILLKELSTLSHLIHGSWFERYSTCSRPNCSCHTGNRHGPRHYLVVQEEGRQRQKYVPKSQVSAALKGIEQYHRLQEIVEEITQINLALMKERAYERS
ncbi:DUF6788 family protein [Mesotoga sp.]|jgi:hypothetical protein|uniref:DUF6788 family protein n=1 Tax=Mesotoga sp. TaxID=2053577 RepID=UPI00345EA4D6